MKIERVNDQQIRCTLTKEDLAARKIEISELAYGTDKARSLFREMMTMAANELDFFAEDIPLMIEAVPMSPECIVLIVTKVEDPEELDTRFAQFSPSLLGEDGEDDFDDFDTTADFMPLPGYDKDKHNSAFAEAGLSDSDNDLSPGSISSGASAKVHSDRQTPASIEPSDLVRLFSFESLGTLISLAPIIAKEYDGCNSLFKDSRTGRYLLLFGQSGMDLSKYNRLCNIISEYGTSERNLLATQAYLEEHCEQIIGNNAVGSLAQV